MYGVQVRSAGTVHRYRVKIQSTGTDNRPIVEEQNIHSIDTDYKYIYRYRVQVMCKGTRYTHRYRNVNRTYCRLQKMYVLTTQRANAAFRYRIQ